MKEFALTIDDFRKFASGAYNAGGANPNERARFAWARMESAKADPSEAAALRLSFAFAPADFAGAYELGSAGVAGQAAVRGIGIAFLMWNATYPAFIVAPQRFRVLGWVILAQQAIGLVGESLLFATLPAGHDVLASSVLRFIAFDGAGLVLMGIAFAVMGFYEFVIVLVELRLFVAVGMFSLVLNPAIGNVDLTAFSMYPVVVVLEIR